MDKEVDQDNEDSQQVNTEQVDPLLDVNNYGYLNGIDAEAYFADSELQFRCPMKKRRRNFKIAQIMPIENVNADDDAQTTTNLQPSRLKRCQNRGQQPTPQQDADADAQLLNDDMKQAQTELNTELSATINL